MVAITDDIFASRLAILQDLFSDSVSAQHAAEHLASISLADESDLEGGITSLWSLIFKCAYNFPEHHDKLVNVLVQLSKLPNAKKSNGDSIVLYDMQVWKDLPMLGWQFRDEWNAGVPDGPPDARQKAISQIINRDKFTARLMATKEPVFAYSWFALITLREALETPAHEYSPGKVEALIRAAAAWISILGADIYQWNEGFDGALGKGGPLWKGQCGFSKERWQFWKERFGELATIELEETGEEERTAAWDAKRMMEEIEK
ncbi:hypothetical protein DTO013E5_8639 [Penicillium roqueforti]|uniref:Uncharacterized protein n=1 Tax=Penicillium roqueforti (strain FM164) TaxID=1365484 RepID=W6QMT2_PENRF|nr:uncharacterized protein LCP9604111_3930 [Penicillium roqueforti]CDM38198.1 Protein of unknown function DUF3632 [Penicillium roqueforti FM164]KAF9249830.1 hypothetical protein LCP9604111_3930 [Penicillium roqueforti]KAI1830453.1 hypothetical protein CBS147337_8727 [Penicillium roqueforti]KAI2673668.1 hypothetical protein CBS147355_7427 [Penicillium roqueforti]KAI2684949.1 hypothetical protein LCP963914a_5041 [Penicillium roqueforti]